MPQISTNALDLIGRTPLIALDRLYPGPGKILGKAEFVQPGGSVKDRAALRIIQDAREAGKLKAGQPVVEMTSGNMGAGLAVVCNILGHPFVAVMSEGNSTARARMLESLGAEVVLVPQIDGRPGQVTGADIAAATEHAVQLAGKSEAFYVDQFHNSACVRAHQDTTGPEIWEATEGRLTAFVAAVGTGGTFLGVSGCLKRHSSSVLCFAVEPHGAEVLAGKPVIKPHHLLQGTGYGQVPPLWQQRLADGCVAVSDEEAKRYRGLLAQAEGLHVGYSAAANVCAGVRLIESGRLGPDPCVVTILCDTGLKY